MAEHSDIQAIVNTELQKIHNKEAREWITARLVNPERIDLFFEYRNNEHFDAWIIGDVGERNVVIIYCAEGFSGFGSDKWGINFRGDKHFGMDSGWYRNLESIAYEWIEPSAGWEVP